MDIFGHLSVWIRRKVIEIFSTDSDGNTAINVVGEIESDILSSEYLAIQNEIKCLLEKNNKLLGQMVYHLETMTEYDFKE